MLRSRVFCMALVIIALSWPPYTFCGAQEGQNLADFNRTWEERVRLMNEAFERKAQEMNQQWKCFVEEQERAWKAYKREIEQKWDSFLASTKKTWVNYAQDKEARSIVDFEKGYVEIEAVIPASKPSREAEKEAKKKLAIQAEKIFGSDNMIREPILHNQVRDKSGNVITRKNAEVFIKKEVLPRIHEEKEIFVPKDGVARKKFAVKIRLVSDHLRKRVERYLPIVVTNAKKFAVEPELVLAIIHTESYFNPMARSRCGAIGLMQIIPEYAGREAYVYVHGNDKVLSPQYLCNPSNNIELGTAYLHLLKTEHFGEIPFDPKNRYLSICGYNWGPSRVKRNILGRYKLDTLSDSECFELLNRQTPKETSKYLRDVERRMLLYQPLVKSRG